MFTSVEHPSVHNTPLGLQLPGRSVDGSMLNRSVAWPVLSSKYIDKPSPPTAQNASRLASYEIDIIPEGAAWMGISIRPVALLRPGGGTSIRWRMLPDHSV